MTPPSSEPPLQHTALADFHKKAGARLVPFAGYEMPIQYSSIIEEHHTVRKAAGLFDVSHMGVARFTGPRVLDSLNALVTRDLSRLQPGQAAYTLLCREDGSTVDDLIVYAANTKELYLVLNASNKTKDIEYLRASLSPQDGTLTDPLEEIVLLALQGPHTEAVLRKFDPHQFSTPLPKPFVFWKVLFRDQPVWLATTGYTGERGVEIFAPRSLAPALWEALLEAGADLGARPCGLGARDTLRTEMGYSLYGHELSESINPVEAGLSWAIGWEKTNFIGREALLEARAHPKRQLIALKNAQSRQAPRPEMPVCDETGRRIGAITSGTFSPTLGCAIGLALVEVPTASSYFVDIRGSLVSFERTRRPFLTT